MILDKTTFGDSPCEVTLAKILTEINRESVNGFVSRTLEFNTRHPRNMEFKDESQNTRMMVYKMFKDTSFKSIDDSITLKDYPEVKSYLKNAVMIRLRTNFSIKS